MLDALIAAIQTLDPADVPAVMMALSARLLAAKSIAPAESAPDSEDVNLTIAEAAALLRRSGKWVYRHRTSLPFIRKIGPRSYICSKRALDRWLARRQSL
ncbi:MAG TPA: helix-turn-helix domain-containing protein [Rhizomicrobium sp.]|jgi:hypothetical protein|nr:helix-turn-helix domain-containing protein [Rhizomicrobium sp.]